MGNTWYSEDDICGGAGCLRDRGWNDNPERRNTSAFADDVDVEITSELCDDRSHVHGGSSSCAGKRSSAGVKSGHGYQVYPYGEPVNGRHCISQKIMGDILWK